MERPEPRTLLERLIQESDRTLGELCEDFERCARENQERAATLSVRQLSRWMAGQVDNARPASRRVARQLWGHSFTDLLGPPDTGVERAAETTDVATAGLRARPAQHIADGAGDGALADCVHHSPAESVEMLRVALVNVLAGALLSEADAGRGEHLAFHRAGAARFRSSGSRPVSELRSNLDELGRVVTRSRSNILEAPLTEEDDRARDRLASLLGGWVETMNRRELLQLLAWAVTAAAASPVVGGLDTDEQHRLARAIASPSRVDTHVIDHLTTMLQNRKVQEDALGSRAVLPMALVQRDLVGDLLAECPAALRPRLLSVYSDISTSIGYYFFELNDINNARRYYEQARVAAHDAGSADLGVYALGEWSYTESWQGRAPIGLDLAAAAQSLLSRAEDPLLRVGAAQRAATAYAFDGRYQECMTEFERARAGLEKAAGQASPESPGYFYNEGYLASHMSECLLRLGKPQEAAASARAGLRLYDNSFVDGYAVCTLNLGNAHLHTGEVDEAARVVGDAAGHAVRTRSARLVKELRTTRARMQPWRGTRAVKELDDRLAAYGLAPTPFPDK